MSVDPFVQMACDMHCIGEVLEALGDLKLKDGRSARNALDNFVEMFSNLSTVHTSQQFRQSKEERQAWDLYAAGGVALGMAEYADKLLAERCKRFGGAT